MNETTFLQWYARWLEYLHQDTSQAFSSTDKDLVNNEPYRQIVALGQEAIPYIMERLLCEEEGHFLIHALAEITGHRFSGEEIRAAELLFGSPLGNQAMAVMWLGWWWKQQRKQGARGSVEMSR